MRVAWDKISVLKTFALSWKSETMSTANIPGFVKNVNKIESVHIHNDIRYDTIILYSYTFLDKALSTWLVGFVIYFSKSSPLSHTEFFERLNHVPRPEYYIRGDHHFKKTLSARNNVIRVHASLGNVLTLVFYHFNGHVCVLCVCVCFLSTQAQ